MFQVYPATNAQIAAQKAAAAAAEIIALYKEVSILFLVSGGSPLEILKYLSPDPFDARVTVGVSDERFSADPMINNFAQVIQTPWYKVVSVKGVQSIDTRPIAGEMVEDAGRRFDAALKAWKQANPKGKIVITQGIGLDGHTAGMMPAYAEASTGKPYSDEELEFDRLFNNPNIWAVGYDAKEKNKYPLRVTTTLPFMRMADDSVVFVCGADKRPALEATLVRPRLARPRLSEMPARIIHEMKHCLLFTDLSVDTVNT